MHLASDGHLDFLRHGLHRGGVQHRHRRRACTAQRRRRSTRWSIRRPSACASGRVVDFGRFAFKRDPAATGRSAGGAGCCWCAASSPATSSAGCSATSTAAARAWEQMAHSPRMSLAYVFLAVMASTGISYFFYSVGHRRHSKQLVATAQRDAAENQLKLLSSQLEPHMLFNTLANLRVLIGIDPPRAQVDARPPGGASCAPRLTASRNMLHPLAGRVRAHQRLPGADEDPHGRAPADRGRLPGELARAGRAHAAAATAGRKRHQARPGAARRWRPPAWWRLAARATTWC